MFNTFKGFAPGESGTFGEHIQQLGEQYHLKILWNSIILGVSVVILCTVIALPLSYIMTKNVTRKISMVRFNHYDSIYDATLYWINGVDADHAEKWAVRPTQPHFLPYHAVFL